MSDMWSQPRLANALKDGGLSQAEADALALEIIGSDYSRILSHTDLAGNTTLFGLVGDANLLPEVPIFQ